MIAAATRSPVMLVHALRGRQRVKVPALYRNPAAKQALETHLASRPGIQSVRANVVTCTVLITSTVGASARDGDPRSPRRGETA